MSMMGMDEIGEYQRMMKYGGTLLGDKNIFTKINFQSHCIMGQKHN